MSIPFPMTILASATSRISHILPELDVLFKCVFLGLLLGLNVSGHWPFVFGFCELPVGVLRLFFHQGISSQFIRTLNILRILILCHHAEIFLYYVIWRYSSRFSFFLKNLMMWFRCLMFFVRYLEYLFLYLTLGWDKVSSPASQYVIAIWSSPLSYADFKWTEHLLLLSFWSFVFVRLLRASPLADNGLCIHPTNIFAPALSQGWCWALFSGRGVLGKATEVMIPAAWLQCPFQKTRENSGSSQK